MKNIYDYTFFQLQQSLERAKNLTPVGTAILILSFNMGLNFLTLLVLLNNNFLRAIKNAELYIIIFYVMVCCINALLLVRNKRHKIIIEKYIAEPEQQRKKGWTYVRLYMILSVVVLFIVIIYR